MWMVANIAKEFGVLPTTAARDLESDPRQLSKTCVLLLRYSEAKRALDSAKKPDDLKPWEKVGLMLDVKRNAKALGQERRARGEELRARPKAKRGAR
jgi:hypothetical protein